MHYLKEKESISANLNSSREHVTSIEDLEDLDKDALGLMVIFENYQGKFIGVVNNFNKKRKIVFLEKITILTEMEDFSMNYMGFFYDSIKSISVISKDEETRGRLLDDHRLRPLNVPTVPQHLVPLRLNEGINTIDDDAVSVNSCLDLETFEPVSYKEGLVPDHIYIDNIGDEFNEALSLISKKSKFGLSAVGQKLDRDGTISYLAIYSSVLHIFDVSKIEPNNLFNSDLRGILEDTTILKVMHDGRALQDYLYHTQKLEIKNVFDIQACDLYIQSMQNNDHLPTLVSDLPITVDRYLTLPNESVWALTEDISDSLWFQRPLVSTALAKLAQSTIFLLILRNAMINIIMTEAQELMDKFVNSMVHLENSSIRNGNPLVVPYDIRTTFGISTNKKKEDRFNKVITYSGSPI